MGVFINRFLYMVLFSVLFSTSCNSILIRPPADGVEKTALVSVSANRIVHDPVTVTASTGTDYFETLKIDKARSKKSSKFIGKMVNYAAETFEKEFSRIESWKLLPKKTLLYSKAYKKIDKKMKQYSKALLKSRKLDRRLFKSNFRSANIGKYRKMVFFPNTGLVEAEKKILAETASQLRVDAAAVMELDIAYVRESPEVFRATVGITLVMVDKNGDYIISTDPVRMQEGCFRVQSDAAVAVKKGRIVYSKETIVAFKESIEKGIKEIVEDIESGLNKLY